MADHCHLANRKTAEIYFVDYTMTDYTILTIKQQSKAKQQTAKQILILKAAVYPLC